MLNEQILCNAIVIFITCALFVNMLFVQRAKDLLLSFILLLIYFCFSYLEGYLMDEGIIHAFQISFYLFFLNVTMFIVSAVRIYMLKKKT